ncbi:hypothetical protein [Streptomyces sp. 3N207]|uniref:hypothetical protein n=1 Tax=Streptomyces sp. 3N207 TaxID=3457417 RepID=UPI003FD19D4B
MQPLPVPCPAPDIPDVTSPEAFYDAYKAAKQQRAVFIGIERQGDQWLVKADELSVGPGHVVDEAAQDAIRAAFTRLARNRETREYSLYSGPVYYVLSDLESEERAREIAAALHAAIYVDLEPLARAVPATS